MKNYHDKKFPGENNAYREARNELLEAEVNLRRQIEEVNALRRKLPNGAKVKEDYVFEEKDELGKIRHTKLSQLFEKGKDSLIIYSFMFGPKNETPCTSCTSILDGLNGMIFHAEQRANIAVVARTSIDKLTAWAEGRGWNNLRLLSSSGNTYNIDYFGEDEKGNQLPILNVFRKTSDGIFHFYATELLFAPSEKGQNGRHVDSIWPLWNLFDYLPEGRGTDWYPKLKY
jgi:predicted dithiol-disulfide oxidoreductase (DUF899 family)